MPNFTKNLSKRGIVNISKDDIGNICWPSLVKTPDGDLGFWMVNNLRKSCNKFFQLPIVPRQVFEQTFICFLTHSLCKLSA